MKIVISFLLLISGTFLKAQKPISFVPLEKGLANNWISTILQDSMGFIWVGTQDGLCRYDGYQFEVLRNLPDDKQSLAANWVRTMAQDMDNNFWIGTYGGGITKFSPRTMDFINFANDTVNGFKGKLIAQILPLDGGQIFGASEAGFSIFNRTDNSHYNLGIGAYNSSFSAHEDTIWLEVSKSKLFAYHISNQRITPLYEFDTPIHLLEYVPELGVLVGLEDRLVIFKDGRIQKEMPIHQKIIEVLRDGSESYLMATSSAIFKFNPRNFELVEIPTDLDLSNKRIQTIFNDKQGSLWVGTDKGLFRLKRYNPAFLKQSIQLHARRIIKNGALYVGGDMGLYKVSGGSIDLIHDQKPILSLAQYGDTILTSARNAQVHRFVNDQWEKKIPLSEDSLKRLAVLGLERDQNNRLWVGSWEGLFVFD
ncbi:MAG: two-component regulator propeller domain-containing protein, partial [Fulvivirga sp.]